MISLAHMLVMKKSTHYTVTSRHCCDKEKDHYQLLSYVSREKPSANRDTLKKGEKTFNVGLLCPLLELFFFSICLACSVSSPIYRMSIDCRTILFASANALLSFMNSSLKNAIIYFQSFRNNQFGFILLFNFCCMEILKNSYFMNAKRVGTYRYTAPPKPRQSIIFAIGTNLIF